MMPRGEPTRAVQIRIPEEIAVSMEERAQRAGRTLQHEIQGFLLGTIRYPGKVYSWDESKERSKLLRQVEEQKRKAEDLTRAMMRDAPDAYQRVLRSWERKISNGDARGGNARAVEAGQVSDR